MRFLAIQRGEAAKCLSIHFVVSPVAEFAERCRFVFLHGDRFNNHSKQLTSSPFQHFGSIMLCIVILAGFYSWKLHKRTQYMWFSSAIFFGGRAFWYFPESKIPKMACSIVQYIVCTCIYCPWMIFKGSSRVFPKS